ncbi:MAG: hypothetical protein WBA93_36975 [Microcoleaceae cyanobacterium]
MGIDILPTLHMARQRGSASTRKGVAVYTPGDVLPLSPSVYRSTKLTQTERENLKA